MHSTIRPAVTFSRTWSLSTPTAPKPSSSDAPKDAPPYAAPVRGWGREAVQPGMTQPRVGKNGPSTHRSRAADRIRPNPSSSSFDMPPISAGHSSETTTCLPELWSVETTPAAPRRGSPFGRQGGLNASAHGQRPCATGPSLKLTGRHTFCGLLWGRRDFLRRLMVRSCEQSTAHATQARCRCHLVAAFLAFLDATIVNIAIPDISRSFPDDSLGDLSWVLNAYNVAFAAFLMPFGRLADRWGRKRSFLLGLAVFTLASCWCTMAGSLPVLVAARVVQAMGGALLVPTSLALLMAVFPVERRAAAVAAYGATSAAAAGIGPSVGGVLVDVKGWELVFLVNLPLGIVAAALGWRVLGESREPRGLPFPDLVGAVALGAGVGALAVAAVKGGDWGWTGATTLGALALAVVALSFVVWRSARHPAPVVDPALLRLRSFSVANAASLVFAVA